MITVTITWPADAPYTLLTDPGKAPEIAEALAEGGSDTSIPAGRNAVTIYSPPQVDTVPAETAAEADRMVAWALASGAVSAQHDGPATPRQTPTDRADARVWAGFARQATMATLRQWFADDDERVGRRDAIRAEMLRREIRTLRPGSLWHRRAMAQRLGYVSTLAVIDGEISRRRALAA